jgi:hypothetical protein
VGASAGSNGVGASAGASAGGASASVGVGPSGVGVGASASTGVGATASVGVSAPASGVSAAGTGDAASSPSNAGAVGVSAAPVTALTTLGMPVNVVAGRLGGPEGHLWRALLKRRCPAILAHSASYDSDLIGLCKFVAIETAHRQSRASISAKSVAAD